jgi:hypothetical protein
MSEYNALKTLTGMGIADLPARLDDELPPEAYKPVPGGADLTDIDPNHMTRVLNQVFGLCGIGWGYEFDPQQVELHFADKNAMAAVRSLTFWFKLVDEQGGAQTFSIPSTGGSDNRTAAYALKGAITSAIGQAASKIGFQESVYLGKRDHRTVNGKRGSGSDALKRVAAAKAAAAAKDAPGGKSVAAKASANGDSRMTLEAAQSVVMPFATKNDASVKGQSLGEIEAHKPNLIDWLAKNKANDALGKAAAVIIAHRNPLGSASGAGDQPVAV